VRVRLTADERAGLAALADLGGITASHIVRHLIRAELAHMHAHLPTDLRERLAHLARN